MNMQFRNWTGIVLISLLILGLFFTFSCNKKDDDEEDIFEDDWGRGGGSGSLDDDDDETDDDDDDTDDDDDDDDDDDIVVDDDDDDSVKTPSIVVVYGSSSQNSSLTNFFNAYGIEAAFVDETDVPLFSFDGYDAIVVTETCYFYQTSQFEAIYNSGKEVLGMYQGGAILFGKLNLWATLGSGNAYDVTKIVGNDTDHQIWDDPNEVAMTSSALVDVASPSVMGLTHSSLNIPSDVKIFANIYGASYRSIISYQDNRYMFWGLQYVPESYTEDTYDLLANLIYYISDV